MKTLQRSALVLAFVAAVSGCSTGGSGSGGSFSLIEFLDSGKENIPRNRTLTFRFSTPVALGQDLPERLKIQNVQNGQGQSDFSRALGVYFVNGDVVSFVPRLPQKVDRSDAGFRADGNYHVFLKAGPDGLASVSGDQITAQQEFLFNTNDKFEDPDPTQPPRALRFLARDLTTNATIDLSRVDPRPNELRLVDSNTLLSALDSDGNPAPRAIDPGAGGGPNYATPWQFELYISEPLDPETIVTDYIELVEIRDDALTGATTADPGHLGDLVNFKVPITVGMSQGYDVQGNLAVVLRVTPIQTLVDDARYRIRFNGNILGIDFNKKFIGENGLTGDGMWPLSELSQNGPGQYAEPGGIGYVSEFLVYDRAAITATRTVTFDPTEDGIFPEQGATTLDPDLFNGAQYNAPSAPSLAMGIIGSFGQGTDALSVSGATVATLDTGDEANDLLGNPFTTNTGFAPGPDIDAQDTYKNGAGFPPAEFLVWDSNEATVFDYGSVTISSSATLNITGVNPCRIVCTGLVQINGTLNAGGGTGQDGHQSGSTGPGATVNPALPGAGGPGGWAGGLAKSTQSGQSQYTTIPCNASTGFDDYLNATGVTKSLYPHSLKGEGPGRGHQGGEGWVLQQQVGDSDLQGTGGGGGSYATKGERGADRFNGILKTSTTSTGQPGKCGYWGAPNSSVIGVRGMPGPTYGDRELLAVQVGGSGGGAGGGMHGWYNSGGGVTTGGAGGGGGGFLEIISSGAIVVAGGSVTVAGGNGGQGVFQSLNGGSWTRIAGSGGGGAGGGLSLISTSEVDLTGAIIDARGGAGGPRPLTPAGAACASCNEGGDGGKGYILLMDPDGIIPALGIDGFAGNHDNFEFGVLTVKQFDPARFGGIAAVTELFNARAANPTYLPMAQADVAGNVSDGQQIVITMSSAKGDANNPLRPDLASELAPRIEVARVIPGGGGSVIDITGDATQLNQFGVPDREAFLRVVADFLYDDPSQAALGPFASLDRVTTTFSFNG